MKSPSTAARWLVRAGALALWAGCGAAAAAPAEYRLSPAADTTIFAAQGGGTDYDAVSDGAGENLWTAVTAGGVIRRSLLRFDLSAIPPGAQVVSATLTLHEIRARDTHDTALHKLLAAWGEAGSNGGDAGVGALALAGDATWSHRIFPGVLWANRGGDYAATATSVVQVAGAPANYTWPSTPGMVADVQSWLDQPATNHGWIVIGTETGQQNAKRFASRHQGSSTVRPVLVVMAEPPAADGDVPLPAWALGLLGAGLVGWLARSTARRR